MSDGMFDDELSVPAEITAEIPVPLNPRSETDTTNEKLAEAYNDLLEVVREIVELGSADNADEIKQLSEELRALSRRIIDSPDHVMEQSSAGVVFSHPVGYGEEDGLISQQESFIGKIGATPTKDSTNYRWSYTWTEVAKTTTGHAGWATKSGGRSGTAGGSDAAYNTMEDMNGATGTFGNGATSTNLVTADYSFEVQPAPANLLVRMWPVTFTVGTTEYTEYWFSYANGVDGSCL